jgi:hypothetical protein
MSVTANVNVNESTVTAQSESDTTITEQSLPQLSYSSYLLS